jgi:AcrR family transcriptional regulator
MARERDEGKRQAILAAAKRHFAAKGFHGTAVSDIAREADLPVGSLYTYFAGKDEVFRSVVDEGWDEFYGALAEALGGPGRPEDKLALAVYSFLPGLFGDVDLIAIIMAEADRGTGLEEKLERLAGLVSRLIAELAASRGIQLDFGAKTAMAAITVYFLGALDAVRVSRSAGLSVGPGDVLDFIRLSIENAFGIVIGPPPGKGR